jgi:hypothetical protein
MEEKQKSRAESFLPEVLPDLIAVLNGAPGFGICGIDITFHEGVITRISAKVEKCRKTCRGCEK